MTVLVDVHCSLTGNASSRGSRLLFRLLPPAEQQEFHPLDEDRILGRVDDSDGAGGTELLELVFTHGVGERAKTPNPGQVLSDFRQLAGCKFRHGMSAHPKLGESRCTSYTAGVEDARATAGLSSSWLSAWISDRCEPRRSDDAMAAPHRARKRSPASTSRGSSRPPGPTPRGRSYRAGRGR